MIPNDVTDEPTARLDVANWQTGMPVAAIIEAERAAILDRVRPLMDAYIAGSSIARWRRAEFCAEICNAIAGIK
jgi:hypothetical protein